MTKHIKIRDHSEIPKFFTGCAEYPNGTKEWWKNGLVHRENGPAVEGASGRKQWFVNGQLHRLDGPAIECENDEYYWHFEDCYSCSVFGFNQLKGNYIVVERGIPTDNKFGNLKLTFAKLLTAKGTKFVYDNLPGLIIEE